MVAIPPSVMKRIRAHAETAYPEECCGFLVGSGSMGSRDSDDSTGVAVRVLDDLPVTNAADEADRGRRFLVEPRAVLDVMKTYRDRDEELVGFYHSHPDHPAELSPTDLEFARLWPRTVWLIVPVAGRAGRERAWWIPGSGDGLDSVTRSPGPGQDLKPQEMTIRSPGSDGEATAPPEDRAITPREEKA